MFEYFHYIFEDTLARLFDTCLKIIKLGEVDKFRQPRVWIRRELPVVIHDESKIKNAAKPIRKGTLNRKWNDEGGQQDKRLRKKCNQPKQCDKRIEEREEKGYREPNPREYI
jgi:hypothetical protein